MTILLRNDNIAPLKARQQQVDCAPRIRRHLPISVENKVRRILFPPQPSKKERLAADKLATAAANRRMVEQKIELGRKLAALRDSTPSNQIFGRTVRRRLGETTPATGRTSWGRHSNTPGRKAKS
jgi:hypothetical protein